MIGSVSLRQPPNPQLPPAASQKLQVLPQVAPPRPEPGPEPGQVLAGFREVGAPVSHSPQHSGSDHHTLRIQNQASVAWRAATKRPGRAA